VLWIHLASDRAHLADCCAHRAEQAAYAVTQVSDERGGGCRKHCSSPILPPLAGSHHCVRCHWSAVTRPAQAGFRSSVAGLSLRRPGFATGSIHVGFMVDKVALGQVFLRVLRFSPVDIIPPSLFKLVSSAECVIC
jgi:hypothetical protein